jgi:hypothetical protein
VVEALKISRGLKTDGLNSISGWEKAWFLSIRLYARCKVGEKWQQAARRTPQVEGRESKEWTW